jgi:hypothetical protein
VPDHHARVSGRRCVSFSIFSIVSTVFWLVGNWGFDRVFMVNRTPCQETFVKEVRSWLSSCICLDLASCEKVSEEFAWDLQLIWYHNRSRPLKKMGMIMTEVKDYRNPSHRPTDMAHSSPV